MPTTTAGMSCCRLETDKPLLSRGERGVEINGKPPRHVALCRCQGLGRARRACPRAVRSLPHEAPPSGDITSISLRNGSRQQTAPCYSTEVTYYMQCCWTTAFSLRRKFMDDPDNTAGFANGSMFTHGYCCTENRHVPLRPQAYSFSGISQSDIAGREHKIKHAVETDTTRLLHLAPVCRGRRCCRRLWR